MEATVTSIAEIKNVRIRENANGINSLVVDNFRPTKDGDKIAEFIPVSIVVAILRSDFKSNILIYGLAEAIKDEEEKDIKNLIAEKKARGEDVEHIKKDVPIKNCLERAIRIILEHLKIKAEYNLHTPEDEYKPGCKYTTNWYQIDIDSVTFSYGEHKDAYIACDVDYFLKKRKSVIGDF